jgi:hypothetical protein
VAGKPAINKVNSNIAAQAMEFFLCGMNFEVDHYALWSYFA